jgi:hypothetical protein
MKDAKADDASELTRAEFAEQWPHAWRLFNRMQSAAISISGPSDALPGRIREALQAQAESEAGAEVKRLLEHEHLARKTLGLRELDLLPPGADTLLQKHAISTVRANLRAEMQRRYRDKARKLVAFFHKQLVVAHACGAAITARNPQGVLEKLRKPDLQMATLDFEGNVIINGQMRWHSISITSNVSGASSNAELTKQRETDEPIEQQRSAGLSASPRSKGLPARATQAEHDKWYRGYRDDCIQAGSSPNVNEDEAAGRIALGDRYDRDKARKARARWAPADWKSRAKRRKGR